MPFCGKCGSEVENGAKFCPNCGEKMGNETDKENVVVIGEDFADKARKAAEKFNDTKDTTTEYDQNDIFANKTMAIISYIWFLCLIPLLSKNESPYAQFHARQGFNLLLLRVCKSVILGILDSVATLSSVPLFSMITGACGRLLDILFIILMVIGIINAAKGKAKELPVIGKYDIWHKTTKK